MEDPLTNVFKWLAFRVQTKHFKYNTFTRLKIILSDTSASEARVTIIRVEDHLERVSNIYYVYYVTTEIKVALCIPVSLILFSPYPG